MRFLLDRNTKLSKNCDIFTITLENEENLFETFIKDYKDAYPETMVHITNLLSVIGTCQEIDINLFEGPQYIPLYKTPRYELKALCSSETSPLLLYTIRFTSSLIILTGYPIVIDQEDYGGLANKRLKDEHIQQISNIIKAAISTKDLSILENGLLKFKNYPPIYGTNNSTDLPSFTK